MAHIRLEPLDKKAIHFPDYVWETWQEKKKNYMLLAPDVLYKNTYGTQSGETLDMAFTEEPTILQLPNYRLKAGERLETRGRSAHSREKKATRVDSWPQVPKMVDVVGNGRAMKSEKKYRSPWTFREEPVKPKLKLDRFYPSEHVQKEPNSLIAYRTYGQQKVNDFQKAPSRVVNTAASPE